jgi:hypothetical protein
MKPWVQSPISSKGKKKKEEKAGWRLLNDGNAHGYTGLSQSQWFYNPTVQPVIVHTVQ